VRLPALCATVAFVAERPEAAPSVQTGLPAGTGLARAQARAIGSSVWVGVAQTTEARAIS
jgi:hypothetical protein